MQPTQTLHYSKVYIYENMLESLKEIVTFELKLNYLIQYLIMIKNILARSLRLCKFSFCSKKPQGFSHFEKKPKKGTKQPETRTKKSDEHKNSTINSYDANKKEDKTIHNKNSKEEQQINQTTLHNKSQQKSTSENKKSQSSDNSKNQQLQSNKTSQQSKKESNSFNFKLFQQQLKNLRNEVQDQVQSEKQKLKSKKQADRKKDEAQIKQNIKKFNETYSRNILEQKQKEKLKDKKNNTNPKPSSLFNKLNPQLESFKKKFEENYKAFLTNPKVIQFRKDFETKYKPYYPYFMIFPALSLILIYLYFQSYQIPYSQLLTLIEEGKVKSIQLTKLSTDKIFQAEVFLDHGKYYCTIDDIELFQRIISTKTGSNLNQLQQTSSPRLIYKHVESSQFNFDNIIGFIFFAGPLFLIFSRFNAMKGMNVEKGASKGLGIFQVFGRDKRVRQAINIKFKNVAGMEEAKKQIIQFVEFLKEPQKFYSIGARTPRGALLTGPPGTGKTMLAKACAGEAGVAFFSLSGSQFVEMYVGVGASRVRNLFKEAKQAAPSIIFIDEIDAIGKKRSQGQFGGNEERDNTLNQLLVEMDGFGTQENVVVFAATNRKQLLDSALLRPGRFDRIIDVDLPDLEGRKQIFQVHLTPLKLNPESTKQQYARRLATLTPGYSGAQIENLCNQAAILAARKSKQYVESIDFELASERLIGGVEKKKNLMTLQEKKVVAYHESGHGVISWFLEGANPLLKLTIIPRSKGSLGFAQYLPDDKNLLTKQNIQDQICVILAGRISQQFFFKKITNGATDDLQKAVTLAKRLIKEFGMSSQLGYQSFDQNEFLNDYSQSTSQKIDISIAQIINKATIRTRQLVLQHKDKIIALSQALLAQQILDIKRLTQILGQRKVGISKNYKEYIQNA